jgi:cell division septal protein FtsQ
MTVKAPVEKNFRRPKGKPARRRNAHGHLSWRAARAIVVGLLVMYAGYRAVHLVLTARGLEVRHVTVKGNVRLSVGDVQALVDDLKGTNILAADLGEYRRRVMESPWVADVALRRVLPSTVELFVSERRPIGLCRLGGTLYLVDRTGTIIDEFGTRYAEFDLPIIDGLVSAPGTGSPAMDADRAELAARVIDGLAQRVDLAKRVSQIDVSDLHDAVVLVDGDSAKLHVGETAFAERLQLYLDVASRLREHVADLDYVDLRFDRGIFVGQPAGTRKTARQASPAKRF